jgi:anti-sigma factor RsiW
MTCRELVDFLADYVAGDLPSTERAPFDAHLAACPECVAYLESYEATIKLGKSAFCDADDALPDDVPEGLMRAILAARGTR